MKEGEKQVLPWWQKYSLSLEEASEYFGISYKKLRIFCKKPLTKIRFWSIFI